MVLRLENKINIFAPPCNILSLFCQNYDRNSFKVIFTKGASVRFPACGDPSHLPSILDIPGFRPFFLGKLRPFSIFNSLYFSCLPLFPLPSLLPLLPTILPGSFSLILPYAEEMSFADVLHVRDAYKGTTCFQLFQGRCQRSPKCRPYETQIGPQGCPKGWICCSVLK